MGKGVLRASGGGVTGGGSGSTAQTEDITLSGASTNITTSVPIAAPASGGLQLFVRLKQSTGGGNQIVWGASFESTVPVDINTNPNQVSLFHFVSIAGLWVYANSVP